MKFFAFLSFGAALLPAVAFADFNADSEFQHLSKVHAALSSADQQKLAQGGTVIVSEPHPDSSIPNTYVFKQVNAQPEEVAAVLSDYAHHKDYFQSGSMKISEVVHELTPLDAIVHYEISIIPYLLYEDYTLRSRLSSYDNGASYRMDRALVKGQRVRAIEGVARAERSGKGTLVMYFGYIDPGIHVSEATSTQDIQWIVENLDTQVMKEKAQQPSTLASQLVDLRARFAKAMKK